jgi:hypothetical protein
VSPCRRGEIYRNFAFSLHEARVGLRVAALQQEIAGAARNLTA